jgi:tRNA modification GTPase
MSFEPTSAHRQPIVAIATPQGRGAVGVVRISGGDLTELIRQLCGRSLTPRHATYLPFLDATGRAIDHGLALYFVAPHSYTGEAVLELQAHGGPVVLQLLVRRCLELGQSIGLRMAHAGEFTERAFLNNKLDLAQAEAVMDLIEANTEAAAKSASQSLSGVFSKCIHTLVAQITHLRMLVEATLDFPEEDIDFLNAANAQGQLTDIQTTLTQVLQQSQQGALLRQGLNVVLVGRPNVGKSSLLNALAGEDLAIVTPIAGTTRDKVTQVIQIEGIPLHIIDTAGLRDTQDQVEQIGISRTWQAIATADVIVHLHAPDVDDSDGLVADIRQHAKQFKQLPLITVHNKIDLQAASWQAMSHQPHYEAQKMDGDTVYLSAKTGQGLDTLRHMLLQIAGWQANVETVFLARERHLDALREAQTHLVNAQDVSQHGNPHLELFAEELRLAQSALGRITGAFSADDLLGEIFSSFCIGK